jgi:hypothetical protein
LYAVEGANTSGEVDRSKTAEAAADAFALAAIRRAVLAQIRFDYPSIAPHTLCL